MNERANYSELFSTHHLGRRLSIGDNRKADGVIMIRAMASKKSGHTNKP